MRGDRQHQPPREDRLVRWAEDWNTACDELNGALPFLSGYAMRRVSMLSRRRLNSPQADGWSRGSCRRRRRKPSSRPPPPQPQIDAPRELIWCSLRSASWRDAGSLRLGDPRQTPQSPVCGRANGLRPAVHAPSSYCQAMWRKRREKKKYHAPWVFLFSVSGCWNCRGLF